MHDETSEAVVDRVDADMFRIILGIMIGGHFGGINGLNAYGTGLLARHLGSIDHVT